jgi:hypothetical protein
MCCLVNAPLGVIVPVKGLLATFVNVALGVTPPLNDLTPLRVETPAGVAAPLVALITCLANVPLGVLPPLNDAVCTMPPEKVRLVGQVTKDWALEMLILSELIVVEPSL